MTADLYYGTEVQSEYGQMVRTWKFDRTINCSAVSIVASERVEVELRVKDRSLDYNNNLILRTNEDIRKGSDGKYRPITAVSVTNIKDASGNPTWINTENLKSREGTTMTKYEIKAVIPSLDMFNNVSMYRIYLSRSSAQKWDVEK
jgi:hypothetical protein